MSYKHFRFFFTHEMDQIGFIPVTARDMISLINEHFCQTAHTASADADQMNSSAGIIPDMIAFHAHKLPVIPRL